MNKKNIVNLLIILFFIFLLYGCETLESAGNDYHLKKFTKSNIFDSNYDTKKDIKSMSTIIFQPHVNWLEIKNKITETEQKDIDALNSDLNDIFELEYNEIVKFRDIINKQRERLRGTLYGVRSWNIINIALSGLGTATSFFLEVYGATTNNQKWRDLSKYVSICAGGLVTISLTVKEAVRIDNWYGQDYNDYSSQQILLQQTEDKFFYLLPIIKKIPTKKDELKAKYDAVFELAMLINKLDIKINPYRVSEKVESSDIKKEDLQKLKDDIKKEIKDEIKKGN